MFRYLRNRTLRAHALQEMLTADSRASVCMHVRMLVCKLSVVTVVTVTIPQFLHSLFLGVASMWEWGGGGGAVGY